MIVLFASGGTICFGFSSTGGLGSNEVQTISGTGAVLATQPLISFSDAGMSGASDVFSGETHTCVVRCDSRVLCFGSSSYGETGLGISVSFGNAVGQMSLLHPIAFDPLKIDPAPLTALVALVLTRPSSFVFSKCQTFYNVWITDASDVAVAYLELENPAATATVNGDAVTSVIQLPPRLVTTVSIAVKFSTYTTTYTLMIRSVPYSDAILDSGSTCFVVARRIVCWGANESGQLGIGNTVTVGLNTGSQMNTLGFISFAPSLNTQSIIEASGETSKHRCALFSSSAVACWGINTAAELGGDVLLTAKIGDLGGEMAAIVPIQYAPTITVVAAQIAMRAGNSCSNISLFY